MAHGELELHGGARVLSGPGVLPGHSDLLVALDPGLVDVRLALSEVGELA